MKGMIIDNEFDLGEMVYLKTDADGFVRVVTTLMVGSSRSIVYVLTCGTIESRHYACEISRTKVSEGAPA